MCVSYAYNLPMISLFSGLFQTNPLLLFSGAPALVLSFVTLYLMYMMKLYTGNKTYSRFLLAPLENLLYWSFLVSTKHMQIVRAWNSLH